MKALCGLAFLGICGVLSLAASPTESSPPAFLQLGLVADNSEYPVTPHPQIEIQTKVDHIAALSSANDISLISHRWVRVHLRSTQPGPELENVITIIRRANFRSLKVLVNVVQNVEDFDKRSEFMVFLSGTPLESMWPKSSFMMRFSMISSPGFRTRMARMLAAFHDHQLRVDAFEIDNELDRGAFDGDLVNRDGNGANPFR